MENETTPSRAADKQDPLVGQLLPRFRGFWPPALWSEIRRLRDELKREGEKKRDMIRFYEGAVCERDAFRKAFVEERGRHLATLQIMEMTDTPNAGSEGQGTSHD